MVDLNDNNSACIVLFSAPIVDLAWDWINQKLYWVDSSSRKVEVYDPATGYRRVFFLGSNPHAIVLDPNAG